MKISNIKVDKMRYQTNSISYLLVMLSVVLSVIALFTLINYDEWGVITQDEFGNKILPLRVIPDFRIGLEIGLGIILMLSTFLAAEKVKYYDAFWSKYGLFILAGVNLLRILNIPVYVYQEGWVPSYIKTNATYELIASAALLILAGLISLRKVILLKNYMRELDRNGNSTT